MNEVDKKVKDYLERAWEVMKALENVIFYKGDLVEIAKMIQKEEVK